MEIRLTHQSPYHPDGDILSIIDNDSREIAIIRKDIDQLIKLLEIHKHQPHIMEKWKLKWRY